MCTFQLLSGTRRGRGHCFPCFFKREETGAEITFHHSIIGYFMVNKVKVLLKQIYCSYSRTHKIQNGFLHSLLVFWRSSLLLIRNKHTGEEFFVFYKFALPSILLLTPALLLLRLIPVLCVISPIN